MKYYFNITDEESDHGNYNNTKIDDIHKTNANKDQI